MSGQSPLLTSRRAVLATGVASIASLAGCSSLSFESPMLDVALENHTDTAYEIFLRVLQVDSDLSQSDAKISDERISIDSDGKIRLEDVAEVQQYVIRYYRFTESHGRVADQGHIHYYPEYDGEDDLIGFIIRPPGVLHRLGF